MDQHIINTYEKGLWLDGQTSVQPLGTYPFMLNGINRDEWQNSFTSNEHGTINLENIASDIIGDVFMKDCNTAAFITKSGDIITYNYDKEERKQLANFSEFGCFMETDPNNCEYLNIQYSTKGCDKYLHWSSNNIYYVINLSEISDSKRKASLIKKLNSNCSDCNSDCNYFKIFRPKCTPSITGYASSNGGSCSAGTYVATAKLLNSDGAVTNWSVPSEPKYINSDHNIPGEEANGRITWNFCNLDCNYNQIEIAITYYDGSQITTKVIKEYYSKDEYTYEQDQFEGDTIQTEEILIKSQINLEGSDLTQYDGVMYYFNIKPRKEYNIQTIANNINVEWVAEKYSYQSAKKYQIKTIPYGETLAFGIVINHEDGTHSFSGHIPCVKGLVNTTNDNIDNNTANAIAIDNNDSNTETIENVDSNTNTSIQGTSPTNSNISFSQLPKYTRKRSPKNNEPGNLTNDDLLADIEQALINSYETDINDLSNNIRPTCNCNPSEIIPPTPPIITTTTSTNTTEILDEDGNVVGITTNTVTDEDVEQGCCPELADELNQFCNVCKGHKDADIVEKDIKTAEDIGVKWASILGDYIGDQTRNDIIRNFNPSTIKEAAQEIIEAVKRRERITLKARKFNVVKNTAYNKGDSFQIGIGDSTVSAINPTYPGGQLVSFGPTKCKTESRNYPCIRDCDGNEIYGTLTGQPITHHTFPDETELSFHESKSIGVPSVATPDADEYSDEYGIYLGARFSNIIIDEEDYYKKTGKRVCKKTPYTITQVKLNYSNKTILHKGGIHSNYISTNKGKEYHYQRHAVNSEDTVNKFIDKDNDFPRLESSPTPANSVCMYSLDQAVYRQYIGSATKLKIVERQSGIGYRHYLYREGTKTSNLTFGRKKDERGAVSATNLSTGVVQNTIYDVTFAEYIEGGRTNVEAPPAGGTHPLMNSYGQPCLWIGLTSNYELTDKSFKGDVYNHDAPISFAQQDYAVLYRELNDQYGSLESLNYIPILQACGDNVEDTTSISGLFGDRYISPYSYVRTSWVSDRVGNKFDINLHPDLPNKGKEPRGICDPAEDSVNNLVGKFFWTELPKDSDPANAKNWAGLYSASYSLPWNEANALSSPQTDYYYPGTLTHLNTFRGETEANPFFREKSDLLKEQFYPEINPQFSLEATNDDPENSYLSQFTIDNPQPSAAEKMIKFLLKSLVNLILPLWKIEDIMSPEGALDLTGDIASLPIMVAMWMLISKVLLTDDFIDDFLGLPKCKLDEDGGIEFKIKSFFQNYHKYSSVFNKKRSLYQYHAMQEFMNCGCDNESGSALQEVYVSDKQSEYSIFDAYRSIRPNNKFAINQGDGKIIDIFTGTNGGLYAHTTDGILSLIESQSRIETTGPFDIITGTKNIIPQRIVGSSYEGSSGIINRSHAINSKYGRYFIDYEANEILLFNGRNVEPLSIVKGVSNLFRNYTKYCSEDLSCINEYTGIHYTLGIDPRFHRLLITKSDGKFSWTISYDLINKYFISFHSYIPKKYLFTREDMYALDSSGNLYSFKKTQKIESNYCNYFNNQYEFVIDTKSMSKGAVNYLSHIIRTDVEKRTDTKQQLNLNKTFDQIGFWNTNQTAGMHHLQVETVEDREENLDLNDNYGIIPIKRVNNEWRLNELYDYTNNIGECIIIKKPCLPFYETINYICKNRDVQTSKGRTLRDSVFYTRLIKKDPSKIKIYIKNIILLIDPKVR